jgi:hypothetical protein
MRFERRFKPFSLWNFPLTYPSQKPSFLRGEPSVAEVLIFAQADAPLA